MKKRAAAIVLLIFLLLSAMAHADITNADLVSDFDEALRILEEYDPYISIIRKNNPEYDALCRQEREAVERHCESAQDLCVMLSDLFMRLGNPAHLCMLGPEEYREYEELAREEAFTPGAPEYRLLSDEQTRAVYEAMGPAGDGGTGPAPESTYTPYVTYDEGRALLCIRIQSFSHRLIERDRNLVIDAIAAHPEVRHIAFDIRGNHGGSAWYWMENLVGVFGEALSWDYRIFFRDDELTRDYGAMEDAVPVFSMEENALPAFVKELGLTHTASWTETIDRPDDEGRILSTDAKRWVLTDEYVFSAADGFAGFCKQTKWATLVGRSTMGDGGGSRPFLVRLPKTGLLMRFSAVAEANEDGTLNAFYGTVPDIPSKPNESAFDTLLRIIDAGNAG